MKTDIEEIVDNIKFVTHPDKDGIMGSCGDNCKQCEKDEKIKNYLREELTTLTDKVREERDSYWTQKLVEPDEKNRNFGTDVYVTNTTKYE